MPTLENPADHGVTNGLVVEISHHIGMLVLNWAFIEQAMSGVFEATEGLANEAGVRVRRPYGFQAKSDQFTLLFAEVRALAEYRPRTDPMVTGLANLTPLRNCVVHGSIQAYAAASGMLTFVKVNPDRAQAYHEMQEVRVALADLEPAADAAMRLAGDMQALAAELIERFVFDPPAAEA